MKSVFKSALGKYPASFLVATVLSLFVIAAVSIVFSFFPPGEKLLEISGRFICLLPAFTAAFFAGKKARARGFLAGMISACLYMSVLVLAGSIIFGSKIALSQIPQLFIPTALTGALGGVLGINFK